MKMIFILALLMASSSFAAQSISCVPTQSGNINYYDSQTGLNRISSFTVKLGDAGVGGYGVQLEMMGTSGTGDKAASSTVKLPLASSYGDSLIEYNNAPTASLRSENPQIKFELESVKNSKTALGVLTVAFVVKDSVRIISSRYNCIANESTAK
ncbi:MAG: hypothetical protein JSU04_16330 [Bdellovibrionales bacterium]|nr:hypothetical protein [Bdellovibrionales bacterium]